MKQEEWIGLVGVGHLAERLVPKLVRRFKVLGISRSFSCQTDMATPFEVGEKFPEIEKKLEAVVWMIPPVDGLIETLKKADQYLPLTLPWIFVGSTSIYGSGVADESGALDSKGKTFGAERFLASLKRNITVLRAGGLVDERRHPGSFFKGKKSANGGNLSVNLVHTEDVANFIVHVLEHQLFGEVFNVVSSYHPKKQDFYNKMLQLKGNATPIWKESQAPDKIVNNQKSLDCGFVYQYDDLLKFFLT